MKKFGPMVKPAIYALLIRHYADPLNSLELLNYYLTLPRENTLVAFLLANMFIFIISLYIIKGYTVIPYMFIYM